MSGTEGGWSFVGGVAGSARVDSMAEVDGSAWVGEGAVVERGAFVGPGVFVGAGCRIGRYAVIVRDTRLGEGNVVHSHAVVGDDPQDLKFDSSRPGRLVIGDGNVIREHVTVHRSVEPGAETRIGDRNYLMAGSHVGHNARLGNGNILANGTMVAGHAEIGDRCVFGGNAVVHQFCTVGDGAMFRGLTGVSMHVAPYSVIGAANRMVGLNVVGLRRNASLSDGDRDGVRSAYRLLFRERGGAPLLRTAESALSGGGWSGAGERYLRFVIARLGEEAPRARGLVGLRRRGRCDEG